MRFLGATQDRSNRLEDSSQVRLLRCTRYWASRRQSLRTARSRWRSRSGSAINSAWTIFPAAILKLSALDRRPPGANTSPAAPFTSAGFRNLLRPAHPAACATRKLPRRDRRASHDGSNLVEGHVEHVMQHERQTL